MNRYRISAWFWVLIPIATELRFLRMSTGNHESSNQIRSFESCRHRPTVPRLTHCTVRMPMRMPLAYAMAYARARGRPPNRSTFDLRRIRMILRIQSGFHWIEQTLQNGNEFILKFSRIKNYPLMLSGEGTCNPSKLDLTSVESLLEALQITGGRIQATLQNT